MALTFEQKLPEAPSGSVPVYQLEQAPSPEEARGRLLKVSRQLGRLGLRAKADKSETSEDWSKHIEGPHELSIHAASGALSYQHQEKYQMLTDRPFGIADEEAGRLTGEFLEATGLVPMEETRLVGVTHLQSGGGDSKGNRAKVVSIDAGVVHGRVIKETAVSGPGGHALINVDPEGEIVGFRIIWRPVATVAREVEIRSPEIAYAAMERIARRVRGDVAVTKASFGYFEQGVLDRQSYLQPAYSMIYTVTDGEVAYKSAEVVPASEQVLEPLMGKKRFPTRAQKSRRVKGRQLRDGLRNEGDDSRLS